MRRAIPGYHGYYAEEDGRIYSERGTGRHLRPVRMGRYVGVTLRDENGHQRNRYVHHLVLETYVGPRPEGMECRHLNGQRHDNRLANLSWSTHPDNEADKVTHGTSPRGERNGAARLTWEQVRAIRAQFAQGAVQRWLCEQYGVSPMTISRIVNNHTWKAEHDPATG